jgi:hypothetical protein
MLIQYLIIIVVLLLLAGFLRYFGEPGVSVAVKIGFLLFLAFGVLAVLYPREVSVVARLVGAGSSADLLLYGLVIAFVFTVAHTLMRFRNLEQRYVRLARTIALRDSVRTRVTSQRSQRAQRRDRPTTKPRSPEL